MLPRRSGARTPAAGGDAERSGAVAGSRAALSGPTPTHRLRLLPDGAPQALLQGAEHSCRPLHPSSAAGFVIVAVEITGVQEMRRWRRCRPSICHAALPPAAARANKVQHEPCLPAASHRAQPPYTCLIFPPCKCRILHRSGQAHKRPLMPPAPPWRPSAPGGVHLQTRPRTRQPG